ncbi:MAG: tRNA (adenosine(37)-N6)-dimethylallyltransferase MiaA [Acidimicrobiales bacterium]|nr:tRNA (adenosine(37)-N6)-dimethylallyltransferase MiaA [Acidimicrobiales bacterium]
MGAVAIVGATATGKSNLALALARELGSIELVSIDSMQVYRGMDIGTAKPNRAEQAEIPHHLIDLVDPWDDFSLAEFRAAFDEAVAAIEARGNRALLVGGTGLYVQAVVDRFELPGQYPEVRAELEADPDTAALHARLGELDGLAASRMEPSNRRRVIRALEVCVGSGQPFSSFGPGVAAYPEVDTMLVGLRRPRPQLDQRIAARYERQMAAGFLDEVRALVSHPEGLSSTARQALGYRELLGHVEHGVPLSVALTDAATRTRRFARRQERWFRRDPRIRWVDIDVEPDPVATVRTWWDGSA